MHLFTLAVALACQFPTPQAPSYAPVMAPPATQAAPQAYVMQLTAPNPSSAPAAAYAVPQAPQQSPVGAMIVTGVLEQPWFWDKVLGAVGTWLEKRGHPRMRIVPPAAPAPTAAVQLLVAPSPAGHPAAAAAPPYAAAPPIYAPAPSLQR